MTGVMHPSQEAVTATFHVPAERARVPRCRGAVAAVLDTWAVDHAVRESALLIMSELVTNAVIHGRAPITVHLTLDRWEGTLLGAVEDAGPGWPTLADHDMAEMVEGGRGLHLVNTLATKWGVTRTTPGKKVWFCLAAPWEP